VSGTVTSSATGEKMEAVTISIKETSFGTITGDDGKYTLSVRNGQQVPLKSYIHARNSSQT